MSISQKTWRTIDLINWGTDYFTENNIENARREIEWLLCHVLKCQRIDLYMQFENPISDVSLSLFRTCIKRRIDGEPFQHIIGISPFFGRDFKVNTDVLIPRPETETIIHTLKKAGEINSILEIGTGSGCLSISIDLENICTSIIATDISKEALTIARSNAHTLNSKSVDFKLHDFLNTDIVSSFDVVVSNPPYIATHEMENLQSEVKNYDPHIALCDNNDGLSFYRRFAEVGKSLLNEGGFMLLEFGGINQKGVVESIFNESGYQTTIIDDQNNEPRIIRVEICS